MANTTPIPTTLWVALGAACLALGGCSGENVAPRGTPAELSVEPEVQCPATSDTSGVVLTSYQWRVDHPLCTSTNKPETIAKGVACTPEDPQHCWKTCGPYNVGFKELTCSGGAYVENSMCNFEPAADLSCFRIPDPEEVDPKCPVLEEEAPRHGDPCNLEPCHVCGGNSYAQTTGYRNQSQGLLKPGYCVCRPAVLDANGAVTVPQKWNCATMGTAWPCPNGCGC